jgi:DNA-directed RNA polymerase III subunit RPC1
MKDAIEELDPLKVYNIFAKIREEDIPLLHMNPQFCRPIDLLIFQLPVPPLCIRPSVAVSQTVKNEDDLTVKLSEIIFFNKEIT